MRMESLLNYSVNLSGLLFLFFCKKKSNNLFENSEMLYLCIAFEEKYVAKVAQLVEHDLAKVGVAGSNPVFRSI
jgi:hypothetical protein